MTGAIAWWTWLWWLGGAALALLGLGLLAWALFADRSRGRRRCPKCWYDLSATPGMRCSECGHEAKREHALFRTRRRWRWAVFGVITFVAAGFVSVQPKVQRSGWWSLISNRMLIAGLPLASSIDDFWCNELARREELSHGIRTRGRHPAGLPQIKLTAEDWGVLFDRCVKGDIFARPPSLRWQRKYGELIHAWTEQSFHMPESEPASVESRLLALPLVFNARTRESWPADVPLYVECSLESWWPYGAPRSAQVTPRIAGMELFELQAAPHALVIADLPERELTIDVVMMRAVDGRDWRNREVFDNQVVSVPIPPCFGTVSDHMKPVRSAEMNAAMGLIKYEFQRSPERVYGIALDDVPTHTALFRDVAVGVNFEFMLDGELVASKPMWWEGGPAPWRGHPVADPTGDWERVRQARPGENWIIRIRSDPVIALRVFSRDQYWEGEVTIPLTITER